MDFHFIYENIVLFFHSFVHFFLGFVFVNFKNIVVKELMSVVVACDAVCC